MGLGEVAVELARKEEESVESGEGPIRTFSEPPYLGGDPEMRHFEVNPGLEESQFNLWRDLRAMYTKCLVVDEHSEANEYFLFKRLQARWDEMVCVRRIARVIRNSPGHECISKVDISRKYHVTTNLLLHELRALEQFGPKSVLPVGTVWGSIPEGEEEHWKQYECEFCGLKYCTPLTRVVKDE